MINVLKYAPYIVVSSIKYDMLQNCHYFLYIYNGLCTIQVNVIVRSPAQAIITISSITLWALKSTIKSIVFKGNRVNTLMLGDQNTMSTQLLLWHFSSALYVTNSGSYCISRYFSKATNHPKMSSYFIKVISLRS